MKIGWVGLGKLGLPCALVMAQAGYEVFGTDANLEVKSFLENKAIPYEEEGVAEAFDQGVQIVWRDTIDDVCAEADVIFVAVQTPHSPQFEGCNRTPSERKDFEYAFLLNALRAISTSCNSATTVVVVSTVNPGTSQREIEPIMASNPHLRYVYSPAFIAMGTTMKDFSNPEMVIFGTQSQIAAEQLQDIHRRIHSAPLIRLSPVECELVKMSYNTFIGMKIVFANVLGELCEKVGGNADNVVAALAQATERIISPKYLRAGMGDGGGCHPRDQLALSWLGREHSLSVDLFSFLMEARDAHAEWLASVCLDTADLTGLPIRVCGREYKAGTNLQVGSPSRLLMNMLDDQALWVDGNDDITDPSVFFIGVNHPWYASWRWPSGSFIIDPWGIIPDSPGVTVRRLGRRPQ